MTIETNGQLLVRMDLAAKGFAQAWPDSEPLFLNEAQRPPHPPEIAPANYWQLQHTSASDHPWDAAHAFRASAVDRGVGSAFVEPDLLHRLPIVVPEPEGRVGAAGPVGEDKPVDKWYPPHDGTQVQPGWHLSFARFPSAWDINTGNQARIAHLDTGYRPHVSTPTGLLPTAGRNFYKGDPNCVIDPGTEWNAGHGTATLALVAGGIVNLQYFDKRGRPGGVYQGPIGGAHGAAVVPIRIGGVNGSVVHLYSSSMARGLNFALKVGDDLPCDVVTLSHGGLPTQAWVDAVNDLYDCGIVLAAASGDNFYAVITDIATHYTVYPSACYRAVTATGATFDRTPYTTKQFGEMQGNWGPDVIMKKSIGGWTPNVPWMTIRSNTSWDMTGSGTSASTPQIAAACALWLSQYGTDLPRDWRRVEACRVALFESAQNKKASPTKIGVGMVDAFEVLNPVRSAQLQAEALKANGGTLRCIPRDVLCCPFLQLLLGLDPPGTPVDEMYNLEALQLASRSSNRRLATTFEAYPTGRGIPKSLRRSLRDDFMNEPDISRTLRRRLAVVTIR